MTLARAGMVDRWARPGRLPERRLILVGLAFDGQLDERPMSTSEGSLAIGGAGAAFYPAPIVRLCGV